MWRQLLSFDNELLGTLVGHRVEWDYSTHPRRSDFRKPIRGSGVVEAFVLADSMEVIGSPLSYPELIHKHYGTGKNPLPSGIVSRMKRVPINRNRVFIVYGDNPTGEDPNKHRAVTPSNWWPWLHVEV